MACNATKKYSKKSTTRSSMENNRNCQTVKTGNIILPESSIPTFACQVPEMKKQTSYWTIGTATLSRVKINCLRSNVEIRADRATTITGMFSEFYAPIETLGTTIIHIFDIPIEINVTRSKQCAPMIADGILGCDFLSEHSFSLTLGNRGSLIIHDRDEPITVLPAKYLINDYINLLRRKAIESSIARERGIWSIVDKRLSKLKNFLPIDVTNDERLCVVETLEDYADCFHVNGEKLGHTKLTKYSVKLRDNEIIWREQTLLTKEQWNKIEMEIIDLLRQDIIKISESPWNSPVGIIEKKPNSRGHVNHRLAVDYRELNNRCYADCFLIPDIIDLTDRLYGAKYFTILDLASASYQIPMDNRDCEKTAFTAKSGRYEFKRMPAGIKNASQNLQRLLHRVLDGICPNWVFVCHDDILIHSVGLEEHELRVRRVLARLRNFGLKLQPDKCQLFSRQVNYLGYRITDQGLRPDKAKINKLSINCLPVKHRELSSFLGLYGYFKRFVPNYAVRCKPMSNILRFRELIWTDEARRSFEDLRLFLREDWLLRYPDWNREFILKIGSSELGIAVTLGQRDNGHGELILPIAHASRCYTMAEANDDVFNRERLAAVYGMETWYWYFSDTGEKKIVLKTGLPKAFDRYRCSRRKKNFYFADERFEILFGGMDFVVETI